MVKLNRRQFLAAPAAAAVSLHAAQTPLIIDTHAHIYSADEERYPTIPKPNRPPGDSGSVATLQRVMKQSGVRGVCIVQTSSFYGFDNRFTCDTAAQTRDWTAGICTLDPDDPAAPKLIPEFVRKYDIRGMRSRPSKDGRMDTAGVQALWKACNDAGIVINVLCNRDNTGAVIRMLEKFPTQRVVIDHCLNLKAGPDQAAILKDMLRLATNPQVHAKLTFLATGSAEEYPFRDMHEPCKKIIDAFGPGRCIWGSDFPNPLWTPKATYHQSLTIFTEALGLESKALEAILGKTAQRLYFSGKLG